MSNHLQHYATEYFAAALAFVFGAGGSVLMHAWAIRLTPDSSEMKPRPRSAGIMLAGATGTLFAAFVVAYLIFDCQDTPGDVIPYRISIYLRMTTHLVLFGLLIAATLTDVRDHVIPDQITMTGMAIGVAAATISGDLQVIHLWIDWNAVIPDLLGPYIPEWIKNHHHWHGLAWSLTGLIVGGGMTWLARLISSLILGQEAMGFGDVTLMAMIGSFVGWQPIVFIFLLAPFCGIIVGVTVKLMTNKPYVPYGPFLSAATVLVLFTWHWIWTWETVEWFNLRRMLGDGPSIAILAAMVFGTLAVLLGLLRLYRMIPGKQRDNASEL